MLVKCPFCQSNFDVQAPGTFKCPVCDQIFSSGQNNFGSDGASLFTTPDQSMTANFQGQLAAQSTTSSARRNTGMNFFLIPLLILILAVAGFGGYYLYSRYFAKSSLDYVQENAMFVIYGNTEQLFDSKMWKIAEEDQIFRKEILKQIKKTLNIVDIEDLDGNFSAWGDIPDGPFRAVVSLKNGNAEELFNAIRKEAEKHSSKVETKELEDCRMLVIYRRDYSSSDYPNAHKVDYSVVLVNDNMLQFSFMEEQYKIFEAERDSDIASSINRSAIFGAAVSPKLWSRLNDELRKEDVKLPLEDLGALKIEVFANKKELEIRLNADISELQD